MLHAHINPNRFIRLYAPANILFPFCLPVSQLQWHPQCALETKRNMLKNKGRSHYPSAQYPIFGIVVLK